MDMSVCAVTAGLFILVTFIALWYLVYDEVAQQTGMKAPRFGLEARRSRRLFWFFFVLITLLLVAGWILVG
jgi:hypothetical protein